MFHLVYRLHPDYQSEPEMSEPEIEKLEITEREYGLMYVPQPSCQNFVETALREPNFSHYEVHAEGKETIGATEIRIECIAAAIRQGHKVYACFVKE